MNLTEARAHIDRMLSDLDNKALCVVNSIVLVEVDLPKDGPRYFAPQYKLTVDIEVVRHVGVSK